MIILYYIIWLDMPLFRSCVPVVYMYSGIYRWKYIVMIHCLFRMRVPLRVYSVI